MLRAKSAHILIVLLLCLSGHLFAQNRNANSNKGDQNRGGNLGEFRNGAVLSGGFFTVSGIVMSSRSRSLQGATVALLDPKTKQVRKITATDKEEAFQL